MSRIHSALLPPFSAEPVSLICTGLPGARRRSDVSWSLKILRNVRQPPHGSSLPPLKPESADDVDVLVAGVLRVAHRARHRAPDPLDVRGALGGEDVVDVAPHAGVLAGLVAVGVLGPRVPVAVHLLGEAQEDRVAEALEVARVAADVRVVLRPR